MKKIGIGCTTIFGLLLGVFAFMQQAQQVAFAQDEPKAHEGGAQEQQPEAKPETQPEAKPQTQQPENAKPQKQEDKNNAKQEEKDQKQQEKDAKQEQKQQDKNAQQEDRNLNNPRPGEPANARQEPPPAGSNREMGQGGQAHPAGQGGHIPDDKFRSNFGRSHTFVVHQTVVLNNQPSFQYGGYTFALADPWPAGWAYTDDCYIDYVDGEYFLFDLLHPGVRIAIIVMM